MMEEKLIKALQDVFGEHLDLESLSIEVGEAMSIADMEGFFKRPVNIKFNCIIKK